MVAIYARQSVDKKEKSISIETQIAECQKELHDGENFQVYTDIGRSGKNMDRENFKEMMEEIRRGLISKVVVYKVDRISRAIIDFATIMADFDKYHVDFVSRNEKFDTSTPMGRAMLTIIMVFAQLERETIQQRIIDNYYARAEQGFYVGGQRPFGFNMAKTELNGKKTSMYVPNESESEILRMIYEKYAEDGYSLGQLIGWLNTPTMQALAGKKWGSAALATFLRNPIYVRADAEVYSYLKNKGAAMNNSIEEYQGERGCYVYGKRSDKTTSKFADLSKSAVTLAPHTGLVSADLWLDCQRKLDGNKKVKNTGKGSYSWLSGILRCAYCGYVISATHGSRKVPYLTCGGRKNKICFERKRTIRIAEVESIVQEELLNYIKQLSVQTGQSETVIDPVVNQLNIQIHLIDEKIESYVEKALSTSGVLMERIEAAVNKLDKERKKLISELEAKKFENMHPDASGLDLQECVQSWPQYSLEERKSITRVFIKKVLVSDERIEVVFF